MIEIIWIGLYILKYAGITSISMVGGITTFTFLKMLERISVLEIDVLYIKKRVLEIQKARKVFEEE